MRILFIQAINMEHLGLMVLSAHARARGHQVAGIAGSFSQILKKARDFRPHLVAASVMTGFEKNFLFLGTMLKKELEPPPLVVFGGIHPTFYPEVVLEDGVDLVVRGEGEGAFLDILDALESGRGFENIPNVALEKDGRTICSPLRPLVDLDSVPFPDRDIHMPEMRVQKPHSFHFNAGRGCPYNCGYCYNRQIKDLYRDSGSYLRFRSPENLIREIEEVSRRHDIRRAFFVDDLFITNRKWLFAFLDAYARKFRFPFFCNVTADRVNPEIASALKEAGCELVTFGVESGSESLRKKVLNKPISDENIRNAAAVLRKAGLLFGANNMIGIPGERLEDAWKTISLNAEIRPVYSWVGIFQPYPGTDMGKKCRESGLLSEHPSEGVVPNVHVGSLLDQPDIEKMVRLHKYFVLACRFPRTWPLVRRLINRDHPFLSFLVYKTSYLLLVFKPAWGLTFRETLVNGFKAFLYERTRDRDMRKALQKKA